LKQIWAARKVRKGESTINPVPIQHALVLQVGFHELAVQVLIVKDVEQSLEKNCGSETMRTAISEFGCEVFDSGESSAGEDFVHKFLELPIFHFNFLF